LHLVVETLIPSTSELTVFFFQATMFAGLSFSSFGHFLFLFIPPEYQAN
jgi:hypothetical protein